MSLNRRIEDWFAARERAMQSEKRPFVTLSYAQSWDGSITTRCGEAFSLSGTEATRLTHQLRSLHDGILVGVGTVLTDDPRLTVREWVGPHPQPIVLDSRLRTPRTARVCQHENKRCWILTRLQSGGGLAGLADILTLPEDGEGRVSLPEALNLLWEKGIRSLMVEGGATVITAFLKARLANALVLTVAPRLVGGYKAVGDLDIAAGGGLPRISPLQAERLGDDFIVWGDLWYDQRHEGAVP